MVVHLVVRQAVKPYAAAFTHPESALNFMNALIDSDYKTQFGETDLFPLSHDSKRTALAEIGFKFAIQSVILNDMAMPKTAEE